MANFIRFTTADGDALLVEATVDEAGVEDEDRHDLVVGAQRRGQ